MNATKHLSSIDVRIDSLDAYADWQGEYAVWLDEHKDFFSDSLDSQYAFLMAYRNGMEKEARMIASHMKKAGETPIKISYYTYLTLEEIARL